MPSPRIKVPQSDHISSQLSSFSATACYILFLLVAQISIPFLLPQGTAHARKASPQEYRLTVVDRMSSTDTNSSTADDLTNPNTNPHTANSPAKTTDKTTKLTANQKTIGLLGPKHQVVKYGKSEFIKTNFTNLPSWHKENYTDVAKVYQKICEYILKNWTRAKMHTVGTIHDWRRLCQQIEGLPLDNEPAIKRFFINEFSAFAVIQKDKDGRRALDGLFTGYYVPSINGRKRKTTLYQYPVYAKPTNEKDLKLTRAQINRGALANKKLELFWTDDFVELYNLHIQGSGNVRFADGTYQKVIFSGKNIHKYSSAAQYARKRKIYNNFPGLTFYQALHKDRDKGIRILEHNKSYVFFQLEPAESEILGSHGSPLIAGRSLAVDTSHVPLGFPMWLATADASFARILFSQDTGSAIKGKVRGDIYYGEGKEAERRAKKTKIQGWYYILLPRSFEKYLERKFNSPEDR